MAEGTRAAISMRRVDLVDLTGPSMSSADTHFSAADSRHAEADSETSFSRGRLGHGRPAMLLTGSRLSWGVAE